MTIPSSSTPTASFTFPFNTTLDKSVEVMVTAPGLPKHTFNLKVIEVCDSNFTVQVKRIDLPSGWNQSFSLHYEVFSEPKALANKNITTTKPSLPPTLQNGSMIISNSSTPTASFTFPFKKTLNKSVEVKVTAPGLPKHTFTLKLIQICDSNFTVQVKRTDLPSGWNQSFPLHYEVFPEPKALANKNITTTTTTPSVPHTLQTGSMTIPSSSTPTASFTFPFNKTLNKSVEVMVTAPGLPKHTFTLKVTKVCDSNFTVQVKRTDLPSGWNQSFPLHYEVFPGNEFVMLNFKDCCLHCMPNSVMLLIMINIANNGNYISSLCFVSEPKALATKNITTTTPSVPQSKTLCPVDWCEKSD
uniref:Uncharacterized protein LOC100182044 n=1 Tax=Phallusia mammillata TaxID=59560 RepID=A0A6F9DGW2_9ASCI|nr:uncharacterized protein LOC100182044 [Phallusia mammillata]